MEQDFSGLYLMSNIVVKNNELQYLIKVGQSKCISNRLKRYKTENPLAECLAIFPCSQDMLNEKEKYFHNQLQILGKRIDKTEWYSVSKNDFENISVKKFQDTLWIDIQDIDRLAKMCKGIR